MSATPDGVWSCSTPQVSELGDYHGDCNFHVPGNPPPTLHTRLDTLPSLGAFPHVGVIGLDCENSERQILAGGVDFAGAAICYWQRGKAKEKA